MANFSKIGYTGLQSKTVLYRLFSSRTYESNMIYRIVKKAKNIYCSDATDCMLKLVELVNTYSSKGGLFDMASDRGCKSKILRWSGSFSSLFVEKYNDFVRIDETRKINIYKLSLVITTEDDSLDTSVPNGFWLLLQKIHHQSRVI